MEKAKTKKMMQGALLLTIAGLISKVLSAIYRIPLQNLTGDIGFYIYQQVYPIVGIGMILALYGYPAAVSKLVAERKSQGRPVNAGQVYVPIIVILIGLNAVFAALLYVGAPQLAGWVGDAKLVGAYRVAAGLFLMIPFLAGLRGFYQGHEQMMPTAVSQVVEQLVRVGVIICCAYLVFTGRIGLYAIGYAGVIASMLGMALAVIGWGFFLPGREKGQQMEEKPPIPWMHYIQTCLSLGMIAAMGHLILLFMQVVDVFTIVPGLLSSGVAETTAKKMKGVFDRGQPLIQIGAVLGSSFALALVPSVAKDRGIRSQVARGALQFSFYIAGAASLGLILLMPEINELLFMNRDGTASLRMLMISVVLTALLITAASILESMGYVYMMACFMIVACGLKWLLNGLLVPSFHIAGSAVGTVVSLFVLMVLVFWLLHREVSGLRVSEAIRPVPFLIASSAMAGVIALLKYSISTAALSRPVLLLFVIGAVITGVMIYLGVMLVFRAFSNQQLEALPFGHRLLSVYEWLDQKKRG